MHSQMSPRLQASLSEGYFLPDNLPPEVGNETVTVMKLPEGWPEKVKEIFSVRKQDWQFSFSDGFPVLRLGSENAPPTLSKPTFPVHLMAHGVSEKGAVMLFVAISVPDSQLFLFNKEFTISALPAATSPSTFINLFLAKAQRGHVQIGQNKTEPAFVWVMAGLGIKQVESSAWYRN